MKKLIKQLTAGAAMLGLIACSIPCASAQATHTIKTRELNYDTNDYCHKCKLYFTACCPVSPEDRYNQCNEIGLHIMQGCIDLRTPLRGNRSESLLNQRAYTPFAKSYKDNRIYSASASCNTNLRYDVFPWYYYTFFPSYVNYK